MPTIIVADENEGRRNLLAGTLEREGYTVTRASTLRQCEGTALATMPDVVLVDGEWRSGNAIDTSSKLSTDPEFNLKCRLVVLSTDSSQEYLVSAATAGVDEVMSKPVNMNNLLAQLQKHAAKMFVPPPAEVGRGSSTGFFDVKLTAGDPSWTLPIFEKLLGEEALGEDFVENIMEKLEAENIDTDLDPETLEKVLRTAFDALILGTQEEVESELEQSRLEDVLDAQAELVEEALEANMGLLDEQPDKVLILTEETGLIPIDPDALNLTQRTLEIVHELLWEIGIPGRLADTTLSHRVEDAVGLTEDAIGALEQYGADTDDED